MNIMYRISKIFAIAIIATLSACQESKIEYKLPTDVKLDMEDGKLKEVKKEYFAKLHQGAPDLDWRAIEDETALTKHLIKSKLRTQSSYNRNDVEELADGNLSGTWIERGSDNQSGSVFDVRYRQTTDELYLISAGGSLFKGKRDGSQWDVLQQDLRFANRFLFLTQTEDIENRIISAIGGKPYYSDDEGATWTKATGLSGSSGWNFKNAVQLENENKSIYTLHRSANWQDIQLVVTNDRGESYQVIHTFSTSDMNNVAMTKPHHSDEVLVIEQFTADMSKLYSLNQTDNQLEEINMEVPFGFGSNERANLIANYLNDEQVLYSYNSDNIVYKSIDNGISWTEQGEIPIRPWEVAMYNSKVNSNILFTGGVNAYRSADGGATWDLINEWYEYYDNVESALHADIMSYGEFETAEGQNFLTISNHGGLSISYDQCVTKINIGLKGLNVSQYYDVSTQPGFDDYVFAGAQDQGFQRGFLNGESEDAASLDQVISGDYGHTVFTENGGNLWTVYPGGWITYYDNPSSSGYRHSYDLESNNESVWIPPLMSHPDQSEDIVYLAGGSADGGDGRFIIELKATISGIEATNLPHDFSNSGGNISAMAVSPFDSDIWYAATDNGRIYKSIDGAQSFEPKDFDGPGAHYLYGADIMPSNIDENTIYVAGSGYSYPGVLKSTDGGETFNTMTFGLPQTTIFNLATNEDESLIFAATEAGPYVYVQANSQWYDMSGLAAPNQTYWSVEYLVNSNVVRFGTYGRGIWDFKIETMVTNTQAVTNAMKINTFPNPTTDILNLENPSVTELKYLISNQLGQVVKNGTLILGKNAIDVLNLSSGTYFIKAQDGNDIYSATFIKV